MGGGDGALFSPLSLLSSLSDSSELAPFSGCRAESGALLGYGGAGLAMLENGPTNGESLRRPEPLSSADAVTVGVVVRRGELAYAGGGAGPFIIAPTIILFDGGGCPCSDGCRTGERLGVGARVPILPSPPLPEPKPVPPVIMLGPVNMGVFVPYRGPPPPPPNVDGLGGGSVRCMGGDKPVSPLGREGAREDDEAGGGGACELWE